LPTTKEGLAAALTSFKVYRMFKAEGERNAKKKKKEKGRPPSRAKVNAVDVV